MGLKKRNNPLGQHDPSDQVGGPQSPGFQHDQSADLVEGVRRRAKRGQNDNLGREPLNTPFPLQKKIPRSSDATAYQEEPVSEKSGGNRPERKQKNTAKP